MNNFSLLVRKKIEILNSEQKQMFDEEYSRRKKPFGDDYNSDLAMNILRDISLTFGNTNLIPIQKNNDGIIKTDEQTKIYGNSTYLPTKKKSNKSYLFNYIYVLVLAFIGVSAYTKPTKVQMQNDIINKFLETQPQLVKFFKNVFLGEEITEEKADNLIYNVLKNSGYEIYFKDSDFWIAKKLEIVDEASDKTLFVAYGFLGKTFITYKADDLVIDLNINKPSQYNDSYSKPYEKIGNGKYEKIDDTSNYKDYKKPNFDNMPTQEESKIPNLLRKKGESSENKLKSEPTEDSIKI